MERIRTILAAFFIISTVFIAGCSDNSGNKAQSEQQNGQITTNDQAKNEKESSDKKNIKQVKATVYFPDENGQKLIASDRTLNTEVDDKYLAAVKVLLQGPKKGEGIAVIPKQAKLLAVSVDKNGIASVNFDNALVKNFSGGSTGEIMLVGSVTDTLTNFPEVKAVRFLVDGKPLATLSGHLDLTEPVKRMKNIL
ncbi:GerMN domain-containing protein [Pectinatus haikarae]|uniref:Spore germination protein GerM n=1 Tax=Pectinatus haikarae TaxID=349096 RepID=A0ABT9Y7P1_9FIRM|nr:GerMN domain-containing protein [Pectinatus haikarae]MDQ0203505.1 spore germination protein GerM [Pectinatus haikarae]